jgi:hypothetical protein
MQVQEAQQAQGWEKQTPGCPLCWLLPHRAVFERPCLQQLLVPPVLGGPHRVNELASSHVTPREGPDCEVGEAATEKNGAALSPPNWAPESWLPPTSPAPPHTPRALSWGQGNPAGDMLESDRLLGPGVSEGVFPE